MKRYIFTTVLTLLLFVATTVSLFMRVSVFAQTSTPTPGANIGQPVTFDAPVIFSGTKTVSAYKFVDSTDDNYYLDPSSSGNSLILSGKVGIGTTNPVELLTLGQAGTAGVLSLAGATSGKAIIAVSAAAGTPTITLPATTGTIPLNNQTMYIGTTATTINRASAAQTLAGLTLTTPVIGAATGTSLDLGATTLYGSRAITVDTGGVLNIDLAAAAGDDFTVDTSKLVVEGDTGNVGIGTAAPTASLSVKASNAGAGTAGIAAVNGAYAIALPPADIRAAISGQGSYTATAGIYSPGIYGYVPTGGHGANAKAAIFDRPDNNYRLEVGGAYMLYGYNTSTNAIGLVNTYAGNVGIGTAPTVQFERVCPNGFTNVKANGNQLGCIQTAESTPPSSWWSAADWCFTNYGARLPIYSEWYVAMSNYALTDETDDWEWLGTCDYATYPCSVAGSGAITAYAADVATANYVMRCWIPR